MEVLPREGSAKLLCSENRIDQRMPLELCPKLLFPSQKRAERKTPGDRCDKDCSMAQMRFKPKRGLLVYYGKGLLLKKARPSVSFVF